jgi:hypothetical protein
LKRRKRKWPYVIAGLLLSLLILSRLYLGLDWFSGALLGVALGMFWTFVVGIAYRQRATRSFSGVTASLIFFSMLSITFGWQVGLNLDDDIAALKLPLPHHEIAQKDWWLDGWQDLPRERTHLASVAAQDFNFHYAGDLQNLAQSLAKYGWKEAAPSNWRWVILSMNPESSELTLPPLKKDYLGHADTLLLHKLGSDPLHQETLRFWDSGVRLSPTGKTLYLGQISDEVLVQRMWVYSYWSALPANRQSVAKLAEEAGDMQTRWGDQSMLLIKE